MRWLSLIDGGGDMSHAELFAHLNAFDRMIEEVCNDTRIYVNAKGYNELYYDNFPPVDVILNKDTKDLTFKFALAGVNSDLVKISFDDDALLLSYEGEANSLTEKEKYIRKGIKTKRFETKYYVPFSKYAVDDTKADFKEGLLTITIPAKEATNKVVKILKK